MSSKSAICCHTLHYIALCDVTNIAVRWGEESYRWRGRKMEFTAWRHTTPHHTTLHRIIPQHTTRKDTITSHITWFSFIVKISSNIDRMWISFNVWWRISFCSRNIFTSFTVRRLSVFKYGLRSRLMLNVVLLLSYIIRDKRHHWKEERVRCIDRERKERSIVQ